MFSKLRVSECFTRFRPKRVFNLYDWVIYKCFCNVSESAELPDWVKRPREGSSSLADSQDDFVVPSTGNWACDWKVDDKSSDVRYGSRSAVDNDVDSISRILKGRFASPEAVVQTLEGCNIHISKSLVEKMLKRFSNDWISAFGFFKWAYAKIDYKHSADAYDSMIDILGKLKQFDLMWELVEEMVQLGGLISLTTMSKITRRLAGAGRWVDAIMTFREVEKFGLSKDTSSMNLLLDTLCKERCVEHAQDAFFEFKNEIPPDHRTFNVLIHGWCKARQLEKAWSTMEEMEEYGFHPCVISYTSLIEAYCHEKDFRKVDSILIEMQEKGCPPNVVTYTIVMHSLGKAKETYEALEVYERMKRNSCVPDTSFFNSLIYILSKAGRLQDAHKIYEEMCRSGSSPNVMTYNTMISAACEHSQEKSALKLLQEMEERLCKPDLKTYAPLLKICCRKKWIKVLFYLLNDMLKKDISLDLGTYSLIIHGLCKSEQLEQACLFFEEMVLKGLVPWSSTFNMLVDVLERKNMENAKRRIQKLMAQAESTKQCHHSIHSELSIMEIQQDGQDGSLILVKQGAEARVFESTFVERRSIVKERFSKKYRHPSLDAKLTVKRLNAEARCMTKARRLGVSTPVLYSVDPVLHTLTFEYVEGPAVKDVLLEFGLHGVVEEKMDDITKQIGDAIGKLHDGGLIHGDLTTSNMLLQSGTNQLVLIDFGLSFTSTLPEDKAVDLYVLERALLSMHSSCGNVMDKILAAYRKSSKQWSSTLNKLAQVRQRGRKRTMVG